MTFVLCVSEQGYPGSLEKRKAYQTIPDPDAEKEGMIRVIDESGEDYLFPAGHFHTVELSPATQDAILGG